MKSYTDEDRRAALSHAIGKRATKRKVWSAIIFVVIVLVILYQIFFRKPSEKSVVPVQTVARGCVDLLEERCSTDSNVAIVDSNNFAVVRAYGLAIVCSREPIKALTMDTSVTTERVFYGATPFLSGHCLRVSKKLY